MGSLLKHVRSRNVLYDAWRKIKANGLTSGASEATKKQIRAFDENPMRGLRRIEDQLRDGRFRFAPQRGVAIKRPGKPKPRPVVVAPIPNRIVQRAMLDVLQVRVPVVREVLDTPTSIGGIPGRGTRHAIGLVREAIEKGAAYFVRSDIDGFFTRIPRDNVLAFIDEHVDDKDFVALTRQAITTQLENLDELAEHKNLFPIGDNGVAQGSPLSPLLGNVLLRNFDRALNGRGITCIRYIDDFVLLGPSQSNVRKAFASARAMLAGFDMDAYDPATRQDKAEEGRTKDGFDFLGCHIVPGLVQPSGAARDGLLAEVGRVMHEGRKAMRIAANGKALTPSRQCYAQTLDRLDRVLKGWGHAFAFCNGKQVLQAIDRRIDDLVGEFRRFTSSILQNHGAPLRRRVLGVHLLTDTSPTPAI